jgi:hypothetical protein
MKTSSTAMAYSYVLNNFDYLIRYFSDLRRYRFCNVDLSVQEMSCNNNSRILLLGEWDESLQGSDYGGNGVRSDADTTSLTNRKN